jgi:hypothetical protein
MPRLNIVIALNLSLACRVPYQKLASKIRIIAVDALGFFERLDQLGEHEQHQKCKKPQGFVAQADRVAAFSSSSLPDEQGDSITLGHLFCSVYLSEGRYVSRWPLTGV